jgi:hypothetical protein
MQDVFSRIIQGRQIFRSEEDWTAYAGGVGVGNAKALAAVWKLDPSRSNQTYSYQTFSESVRDGYVWMDFVSIPQTLTCDSLEELAQAQADQIKAIDSIPKYVHRATNFFVCAPSHTYHKDIAEECNYETWRTRGWCRRVSPLH